MTTVFEDFSDYIAPPNHVTFTVLDQEHCGHSVSVASGEYHGLVYVTKTCVSNMDASAVFESSIEIIRSKIRCEGGVQDADDGLFCAFISALLKHPDKRTRKKLIACIDARLKKEGGAHVILIMPPTGPSAWALAAPVSKDQRQ
jgi:hypothetical protein